MTANETKLTPQKTWTLYPDNLRELADLADRLGEELTFFGENDGRVECLAGSPDGYHFGAWAQDPSIGVWGFTQHPGREMKNSVSTLSTADLRSLASTLEGLKTCSTGTVMLPQVIELKSAVSHGELALGFAVDQNGDGGFSFRHQDVNLSSPAPPLSALWD